MRPHNRFFLYSRDKNPHKSHIILAVEIFPRFILLLCINGIMLYHNPLCNQIYGRKPDEQGKDKSKMLQEDDSNCILPFKQWLHTKSIIFVNY